MDITYIPMARGFVYLAVALDWFNRGPLLAAKLKRYLIIIVTIPRSRHNPKILWVDDAEIIGHQITASSPVLGDFLAQEIERGVRELSACGVASVVRDVLVHEAP